MFLNHFNAFLKFEPLNAGFLKFPEISALFLIRAFLINGYCVYALNSQLQALQILTNDDEVEN